MYPDLIDLHMIDEEGVEVSGSIKVVQNFTTHPYQRKTSVFTPGKTLSCEILTSTSSISASNVYATSTSSGFSLYVNGVQNVRNSVTVMLYDTDTGAWISYELEIYPLSTYFPTTTYEGKQYHVVNNEDDINSVEALVVLPSPTPTTLNVMFGKDIYVDSYTNMKMIDIGNRLMDIDIQGNGKSVYGYNTATPHFSIENELSTFLLQDLRFSDSTILSSIDDYSAVFFGTCKCKAVFDTVTLENCSVINTKSWTTDNYGLAGFVNTQNRSVQDIPDQYLLENVGSTVNFTTNSEIPFPVQDISRIRMNGIKMSDLYNDAGYLKIKFDVNSYLMIRAGTTWLSVDYYENNIYKSTLSTTNTFNTSDTFDVCATLLDIDSDTYNIVPTVNVEIIGIRSDMSNSRAFSKGFIPTSVYLPKYVTGVEFVNTSLSMSIPGIYIDNADLERRIFRDGGTIQIVPTYPDVSNSNVSAITLDSESKCISLLNYSIPAGTNEIMLVFNKEGVQQSYAMIDIANKKFHLEGRLNNTLIIPDNVKGMTFILNNTVNMYEIIFSSTSQTTYKTYNAFEIIEGQGRTDVTGMIQDGVDEVLIQMVSDTQISPDTYKSVGVTCTKTDRALTFTKCNIINCTLQGRLGAGFVYRANSCNIDRCVIRGLSHASATRKAAGFVCIQGDGVFVKDSYIENYTVLTTPREIGGFITDAQTGTKVRHSYMKGTNQLKQSVGVGGIVCSSEHKGNVRDCVIDIQDVTLT